MVLSVVPGQVLKLNCWMGRHLWLKQTWSVPQAVPSSTYPRSMSPSISTWAPLNNKHGEKHRGDSGEFTGTQKYNWYELCRKPGMQNLGTKLPTTGVYLQSREALCRATEKEVSPPWSSPSRGAGEMLEHSRYPQWTSLTHKDTSNDHRKQTRMREQSCSEFRLNGLTVCYTGSRCPCPSRSCLFLSLQCLTSHNRTCQLLLPLMRTEWDTNNGYSSGSWPLEEACSNLSLQILNYSYSLPKCICTAGLLFCTFH